MFAVEPHVAHEHDALEVEHHSLAFPFLLWGERISVPSHVHLLEATRTESAAHVASGIAVVGTL